MNYLTRNVQSLTRSAQWLPNKLSFAPSSPARRNARSVPPPHRRCAPRARLSIQVFANIYQASGAQLQKPRPRSPDFPLSISPPGSAHSAGPAQNRSLFCFIRCFFRFFRLPKRCSKNASKKHGKKCENRGFWPPKIIPKSCQNVSENDVPTNMRFFKDFCSKKSLSQERRHRFRIGFSNTFCLSDAFLQIAFGMDFGTKKTGGQGTSKPSRKSRMLGPC